MLVVLPFVVCYIVLAQAPRRRRTTETGDIGRIDLGKTGRYHAGHGDQREGARDCSSHRLPREKRTNWVHDEMRAISSRLRLRAYSVAITCTLFSRYALRSAGKREGAWAEERAGALAERRRVHQCPHV
jgi:hypothetical protein